MSSGQGSVSFLPKSCNFVKWAMNLHGCALRYCMGPVYPILKRSANHNRKRSRDVCFSSNESIQKAHSANLP